MYFDNPFKTRLPETHEALPGRLQEIQTSKLHSVLNTPFHPPFSDNFETLVVGMGCFWGAERLFWNCEGVYSTAVGYAGGQTPNPTYEEVCSGNTGHAEVVRLTFDENKISFKKILDLFFKMHDPTQKDMQFPDVGTQYRSEIFYEDEKQKQEALEILKEFNEKLDGKIQTNVSKIKNYSKAEEYHQKYIEKNR